MKFTLGRQNNKTAIKYRYYKKVLREHRGGDKLSTIPVRRKAGEGGIWRTSGTSSRRQKCISVHAWNTL